MKPSKTNKNIAKKTFREKGTCSQTFAYLLNRSFNLNSEDEERATDPLAGGIMKKGHQCGMLWGSALAVGARAYEKTTNVNKASYLAILATKELMDSFSETANTISCKEITGCSMDTFLGLTKYMIKVTMKGMDNSTCFNLAEEWYPEAIKVGQKELGKNMDEIPDNMINCASEVVNKMGGTKKEEVMVAGFAGGMGLSGNGCGALSAAIWYKTLKWIKENPDKRAFGNMEAKATFKTFKKYTNNEMICKRLSGQDFSGVQDHSNFIKTGGCKKLIYILSES